jgi:flagellar assembly factor FliW
MSQATLKIIPERESTPAPLGAKLVFPRGLVGLPEHRDFRLLESTRTGLFWLREEVEPGLCFLLADPFEFFDGYEFELSPRHAELLGVTEESLIGVMVVTVPNTDTGVWTANLQGPIVMDFEAGTGVQLVLPDHSLGVRKPFEPFPIE